MQRYIIYKVSRKLKQSKVLYGFMTLQFAFGFFILNIFLTASISVKNDYTQMLKGGLDKEYGITVKLKHEDMFSREKFDLMKWGKEEPSLYEHNNPPFDLQDISNIEELTGGNLKAEVKILIFYLGNETRTNDYTLYYRNNINNIGMSRKFVEITSKMKSDYTLNPRDFPYKYDINEQILLCELTGNSKKVDITNEDTAEAILPLEWYIPLFHYKDIMNMKLTISFQNTIGNNISEINQKMQEVKSYLSKKHIDYEFLINNEFFDYMGRTSTLNENSIIFNFIASVIFLIILIGLIGLFMLFMERRKKELAIAIALGARKEQLICEVLIEILFIALTGYLLGVCISSLLLIKGFSYATVAINFNLGLSLMLVILPIIVTILAVLPSIFMIKNLSPMKILRNL